MERVGLVSQVEAELEKMLSLELLPKDRGLPSEHKLARVFGVSRGTVREALLRLSAKGLVVQHPGRRTYAVPLDEAVTLENLSVILDGDGLLQGDRWRLLESFFALKRDLTVELLVAACEKASPEDLEQLGQDCYALGDAAHWDEGERKWVQQEFALLRLAASATDRFGHVLLIQSLQRAFRGMATWVLPHMDSKAVRPWTLCAMNALAERDAQALRQQLPALLQAADERLLRSLLPNHQSATTCEPSPTMAEPLPAEAPAPEPTREEVPEEVLTNLSNSRTGSCVARPTGASPPEAVCARACYEPAHAPPEEGSQDRDPTGRGTELAETCPPASMTAGAATWAPRADAPVTCPTAGQVWPECTAESAEPTEPTPRLEALLWEVPQSRSAPRPCWPSKVRPRPARCSRCTHGRSRRRREPPRS
jgi:GntR family transcriptional repressor for pyruvate dehydrogenase complex